MSKRLAVVAAMLVLLGAGIVYVVRTTNCVDLAVWSSDEKFDQVEQIATQYEQAARRIDDTCVSVSVIIHGSLATADALSGLGDQRLDPATGPVIWTPSSSIWVERLRNAPAQSRRVRSVGNAPSLATSPVVIAMPEPMARALGWPEATIGWRDLLALARDPLGWGGKGHPEWGSFKLGKTNPLESTTGLLSTIATATALAGNGELTMNSLPRAGDDLRALEQSTVHYGRYVEAFVGNLYQRTRKVGLSIM